MRRTCACKYPERFLLFAKVLAELAARQQSKAWKAYWQRHGMACAAAAIEGAAIGAAHFEDWLPDPEASTLAATKVPKEHLTAGLNRRAHSHPPIDSLVIRKGGRRAALARLFQV